MRSKAPTSLQEQAKLSCEVGNWDKPDIVASSWGVQFQLRCVVAVAAYQLGCRAHPLVAVFLCLRSSPPPALFLGVRGMQRIGERLAGISVDHVKSRPRSLLIRGRVGCG